jgi:hypothetical protein
MSLSDFGSAIDGAARVPGFGVRRRVGGASGFDLTDRQRSFASALGVARRRADAGQQTPEQAAREAAEGLVSIALVQPMLAAVREANTAPPPFGPTDVEKRFGSLMDAERASGLVKGANWGIVDRLTADLIGRHERAAAAGGVDLRVDPRGA